MLTVYNTTTIKIIAYFKVKRFLWSIDVSNSRLPFRATPLDQKFPAKLSKQRFDFFPFSEN